MLLAGCATPWKATWTGQQESYGCASRSVLSGDLPSEFTRIALRRHDLTETWQADPARALAMLRGAVVGRPEQWPDLFALAELHFLRGRQTKARAEWLAAAIYAYAYLFSEAPSARPAAFDPRFRQACDIYNVSLAAAFTKPGTHVLEFGSGGYPLPLGALDVRLDPASLSTEGRSLASFRPTQSPEIEGPRNVYYRPGIGAPLAATAKPATQGSRGLRIAPRLDIPANSSLAGFFRHYELFYVVADERDLIGVRTDVRREEVYLYRAHVSTQTIRSLFSSYLDKMASLERRPEWYNTLSDNCTTGILTRIGDGPLLTPVPYSWRVLFSGYAAEDGYRRGLLNTTLPFDELQRGSRIVRPPGSVIGPGYSREIRRGLPLYGARPGVETDA